VRCGRLALFLTVLALSLDTSGSDNQTLEPRIGSVGPKTVDRHIARQLLDEAESRRIDIVMLGDSNQRSGSFGWQDGWTTALGDRYHMYATPILGAGAHRGIGLGIVVIENDQISPVGAPPDLLPYSNPDTGVDITPYGFMPMGSELRPGADGGMRLMVGHDLWADNNFNANAPLRAHFSYGVTPTEFGTTFRPTVQQALGLQYTHPPINTGAGNWGIAHGALDIPAAIRNANDIVFRWVGGGHDVITGPLYALHMRFENTEQHAGFSNHTLYGVGGASARDCAEALQRCHDEQLRAFFQDVRELQPDPKRVLVRIALGGNDRTDSLPSLGPNAGLPSNTGDGVADNHHAIINRIRDIWTQAGWDPSGLVFLLVGNHPKPSEPPEFGFRGAIADIAANEDNIAFINLAELATAEDFEENGWYHPSGPAHLTYDGYRAVNRLEIAAIVDLPADLNGDCVVDTADLGILLAAFGAAPMTEADGLLDLNFDNQIDTADLGILLEAFGHRCQD